MKLDLSEKLSFKGKIVSIQPRILLTRSFDERFHNYLGYAIFLDGRIGEHERDFSVGLGKVTQAKRDLRAGDLISGQCLPVPDRDIEPVEFYKLIPKVSSTVDDGVAFSLRSIFGRIKSGKFSLFLKEKEIPNDKLKFYEIQASDT
jgi:hypothetical protein